MPFSDEVVEAAWKNADGKCERCGKSLSKGNRGEEGARGAWEAHHKTSVAAGGGNTVSNSEILCLDCHKASRTYG